MAESDVSPAINPFPITPSDSVDIAPAIRGFSVQVAGDVKVTNRDGTTKVLPLPAGMCPAGVRRIWATGTTATGFVGYP